MSLRRKLFYLGLAAVTGGVTFLYLVELKKIEAEPISSWTEDHRADCAVVLTGSRGRVREGLDLLAQNSVKKLIVSGVNPSARLHEIFPQWIFYGSLHQQDIILEKRSSSTFGNALQTLPLVEALNCQDIILVTSQLHMYRAHRIFRSVYPPQINIIKRSVPVGGPSGRMDYLDYFIETTKSLFYSLWAY